ncbi:MAG TPA: MEDS domain-containing protein [Lacunisphaera sp.]|nr:MEDS domain-containing protein [Lacunisphaera sp.]
MSAKVFWGEISPCQHLLHLYPDENAFLDILEEYVSSGLRIGETTIVIATPGHCDELDRRLEMQGIDVKAARGSDRYIVRDAAETIDRFMVDGWPDEKRFQHTVRDLLSCARESGPKVRAFGEMVALLWDQGHCGATVRLEHLWHELSQNVGFSLLCSYPRSGFTQGGTESLRAICAAHHRTIGPAPPLDEARFGAP